MTKDKKIQWHPAFFGAMHLEFKDNKDDLAFSEEVILNTLPLRIDMLIVKKKHPCNLHNEMGKLFGKHNLIEYKSPDDTLNYNTFIKGIAYAYLYKTNETYTDEIQLTEMSLSFIRERKPIKLLKRLKKEDFTVEEKYPGIYYIVKEGHLKIQIVVSKELHRKNHIWLNSLSTNISEQSATELIMTTQQLECPDEKNYADSLWEVVATVNKRMIQKLRRNEIMCEALAKIMKPEIDAAVNAAFDNGFNDGFNNGFFSIIERMLTAGKTPEQIAEFCGYELDEILTVQQSLQTTKG